MDTIKHPKHSERLASLMYRHNGLDFLNTSIIPPGADGVWVVETVEANFIHHCLLHMGHQGATDFVRSHIGHEATAAVASELFKQPIPQDRTPWDGSGVGVALQLNGRFPEGANLSREEMEQIGYTIRVLFRLAEPGETEAPK